MKKNWKKSKIIAFSLTLVLSGALLAGCGSGQTGTEAAENSETEALAEELQEYKAEGVGTFYLPEGFEMESGTSDDGGLPRTYAELTKGNMSIYVNRFGKEAYEAAGVALPADLEEYSQRENVKNGLPEGTEFAEDDYGNLCAEYTEDGNVYYQVLKAGTDAYGAMMIVYPEGEEPDGDIALWASKAVLE